MERLWVMGVVVGMAGDPETMGVVVVVGMLGTLKGRW